MTDAIDAETLKKAKEVAKYHHEWWYRNGYSSGLKGTEIPLAARIKAVADVFDALISIRSYKDSFSIDEALEIIKDSSGIQFDPDIVDVFLAIRPEIESIINESTLHGLDGIEELENAEEIAELVEAEDIEELEELED